MAAAARRCDGWLRSAEGALGLLLLLDQYPRNSFRGTAHMYAVDSLCRVFARQALEMHRGLREDRPIRGKATPEEVQTLHEDEVEVFPLPVLPEEHN